MCNWVPLDCIHHEAHEAHEETTATIFTAEDRGGRGASPDLSSYVSAVIFEFVKPFILFSRSDIGSDATHDVLLSPPA